MARARLVSLSTIEPPGFAHLPDARPEASTASSARLGAGAVLLFLAHAFYLSCVAEDAFIAFRFARHLATGHGLVWNIGEAPVEGYTDFLWVLLSAGIIRLGLDIVPAAQMLSVAGGLATLWVTYRAARTHLRLEPREALLPVWLLAAAGPFATWSASGMEMTLFTLFAVVAAHLTAQAWGEARGPAAALAAVALVAATLTRPEGVLLALVLLGGSTAAAVGHGSRLRRFAAAATLYAVLFGIYFWWRYSYFGYPLPNTFYAKTGGGLDQILRGGLLAFLFYMQFGVPLVPLLLVAAWEFGTTALRPARIRLRTLLERHAFPAAAVAIVAAYSAYTIAVGGDYMAMHRFFVPVLPFLYLLIALPAAALRRRIRTRENAAGYAVLLAVTLLATFFPSTPLERSFFYTPPQQHGAYRGVQTERWHVNRLTAIGRFFDGYRRSGAESLATSAIGAIGFHADMRIFDMHGLVDTHIAHLPAPPDLGRRRPGHGREDLGYTLSRNPTFVMFSRDLTQAPIELWRHVREPAARTRLEHDYVPRSMWLQDPENGESGYFTFFERRGR